MKKLKYLAPILIAVACLGLQQAKADTFTFTSDHCDGGCGPQPGGFGTVTLTQAGSDVNVSVSLNNGNKWIQTGAGNNSYFLFDNAGITLANITNVMMPGNPGGPTIGVVGGHADGTGTWMWAISCPTCGTGGSNAVTSSLTFTVTNTTLAAMEVGHAVGSTTELFVADILSGTTGMTGDVDVNTGGSVPDGGATVMLLGVALGALGMVRRYLTS